ncbi:MAG TPA: polysaccharide biosynthesis tyrosine autokinase [Candidatus Polarisedimenticolia bacterium]|jgi:capsular exopolysaccharide synthesis family protein
MQQDEIGLQHYFEVLWRRRWLITAVFTIVVSLSAIGILLSKTTYKVHSLVAVKNQIYYRAPIMSFSEGTETPATTLNGESYIPVINGLPFAEKVAENLLLDGMPLDALEVAAAIKGEFQQPDLVLIHASSIVPEKAVAIANAAAAVFVADTKAVVTQELDNGRDSAMAFQAKYKKELEDLEKEIAQFRRAMGFVDINSEMEGLREKAARFEGSRGEVITKLEIAQSHKRDLLTLARAGSSGELNLDDPRVEQYRGLQQSLTEARVRYTDDHPAMKNLLHEIEGIENRLKGAIARTGSNMTPEAFLTLKEDLARTDAEIVDLQTAIASWTRQIEEIRHSLEGYPEKLAQLQGMQSRQASAQESYKSWSNRLQEIEFKKSMVPGNAEILDRAVKPSPAISKPTSLVIAFLVSLMLAFGIGFLIEFADTTLRSPEEITGMIGLGYLGGISKVKEPRSVVFADGKPTNQIAEAYTRIYSNIRFAEVESPLHSILITSACKGEGKSTTLVNLACAIAAAGKRVIIVDTDLRNPTLLRILGLKYATGLTSVLAGEASLDEALQPSGHPGLTVLPAGPIPPNPAELLHSQRMKEMIEELESRCDLVIFDSPPTLLVADAMLLGGGLDAAIIVAESGGVSRRAVQQVKESLQMSKTRILGVILNKILESPGSYYNYYSYYKYYKEPEGEPQTTIGWIKGGLGSIRRSVGGRS